MTWKIIERPGYSGPKRNELYNGWDNKYGKENWKNMWTWGKFNLEKPQALQIYEDAYYEFFKNDMLMAESICAKHSEVYDNAKSNVESGFDYTIQEAETNHFHDIAIRTALMRLNLNFRGDTLLEVRGPKSEGFHLDPARVPFHMPFDIYKGEIKDYHSDDKYHSFWWRPGNVGKGIENSVEEFYQANKGLFVKLSE